MVVIYEQSTKPFAIKSFPACVLITRVGSNARSTEHSSSNRGLLATETSEQTNLDEIIVSVYYPSLRAPRGEIRGAIRQYAVPLGLPGEFRNPVQDLLHSNEIGRAKRAKGRDGRTLTADCT